MPKRNRRSEELWNVITHGTGAILSLAAFSALVFVSMARGTKLHVITCTVFGLSLILLYGASTIYHAMSSLRWKRLFRKVDHLCIYILIAGTYTPFALIGLRGFWGWMLFGLIWTMALAGFIFKFSPLQRSERLSLGLYAGMGWLAVIAVKPIITNLVPGALALLTAGGLFYTCGIFFYTRDRMPYAHAIWHVFVLAGSACHFFGVFLYLIP